MTSLHALTASPYIPFFFFQEPELLRAIRTGRVDEATKIIKEEGLRAIEAAQLVSGK